ncbi:aminomethyltransferase, mitochondrial isoform X1 [Amblyomma americanum]
MRVPGCRVILRRGPRSLFQLAPLQLRRASSDQQSLQRTALYDFHVKHGGKMVPFAGYAMPVQYSSLGLGASHLHTRRHASLFDVSHMLQSKVHGPDRVRFVESLVVSDIEGLADDSGTLTVYTNEKGGIIDDLIVNKTRDFLYVVSNAGCRDKDLAHVKTKLAAFQSSGGQATLELMDSWSLLAIQGPAAAELLQPLVDCTLASLHFMRGATVTLGGISGCRITRCGYTGEDGFELSVPSTDVTSLAEELLSRSSGRLQLAGLGARDSLRIEAGLCLYGQDIDEETTPVEAGLAFTIGKRRRQLADFPGAPVILDQLKQKPSRRRVGLMATTAGPPARCGAVVYDSTGSQKLGQVTSGIPSPSLGSNIAMAYVPREHSAAGTNVQLEVRGRRIEATVTRMPFVPSHYYTG